MTTEMDEMVRAVATELGLTEDDLLQQGLRKVVEQQLRMVKAEILEIRGRYGVADAQEIEARYRQGTLDEADSWRDLQRLDHLEYRRDRLQSLLEAL